MNNPKNDLAELRLKMFLSSLSKAEPVPEKLAAYLMRCTDEEKRWYFLDIEKFEPLIVEVNEKMYVFDFKDFVEDEHLPIFENKHIKINPLKK